MSINLLSLTETISNCNWLVHLHCWGSSLNHGQSASLLIAAFVAFHTFPFPDLSATSPFGNPGVGIGAEIVATTSVGNWTLDITCWLRLSALCSYISGMRHAAGSLARSLQPQLSVSTTSATSPTVSRETGGPTRPQTQVILRQPSLRCVGTPQPGQSCASGSDSEWWVAALSFWNEFLWGVPVAFEILCWTRSWLFKSWLFI